MRKFNNVSKYAGVAPETDAHKFITGLEDYTKEFLAQKVDGYTYSSKVDVSLADKALKLNELYLSEIARRSKSNIEDFNGDAYEYATDPSVIKMQSFLNKITIDTITPIFVDATGLTKIAEMHYGGYGDVFEFELRDSSNYTLSKMGRRQKHTKTQSKKKNNKTISMDVYGLSTIATLPEIILGDAMVAEDAIKVAMSITAKVYQLTMKKFISACETITDSRFVLTSYTEVGLIEKLEDGSAFNGTPMTVIGTPVALKTVLPESTQTRIFLDDEFNTTLGYMSTFNTYKVLAFATVRDDSEAGGVLRLPKDRLYGISLGTNGKLIHVGLGNTMVNADSDFDNDNLAVLTTTRKEIGVELATNQKVVRVDLA